MKGILHKTDKGWVIRYDEKKELPVHPEYEKYYFLNEEDEGEEAEFEVEEFWETGMEQVVNVAKLARYVNDLNLTVNTSSLSSMNPVPNSFTFQLDNKPIIIIDETGFNYRGVQIEDEGEIYKAFMDYFQGVKNPIPEISDEEIEQEARKLANIEHNRRLDSEERYYKDYQKYDGIVMGMKWYREQLKK